MARFQKNLIMPLIFALFVLPATSVEADSIPPFEVLSVRVEKDPNACRSTLFATIRNNTQTVSDSGLFVHAKQFQELQQQGQRLSSPIGVLRLDNLPAGQSREIGYSFFRERLKTGVSFRFKIIADTIAYTEKPLPPVLDQYDGKVDNVVYDQSGNVLTGSVGNRGSVAIPRPAIQVYLASPNEPDTYKGGGGGKISECLAPGQSAAFSRPTLPEAAHSIVRVDFIADGLILDSQILGEASVRKPKTIDKLAPDVKKQMRTIKPRD